jgi:hypothetical protein
MKSKVNPLVIGIAVLAAVGILFLGSRLLGGDGSSNKEYKINLPTAEERNRNAPEGLGGGG